ncbi:MAG: hypothetical protein HN995_03075 [Candidatus Marinimicrobia bacterium]|jgi:hypothetical protein|nr:hypothetical protein [Candidatus Neomarinimicrobiota bacterium]MBT3575248.1 hypothetical protein [Candidatus Neomarinimicrobiota bacterium]MBT3680347.1 hypothetical protein [Candidatus Neomarinimicrobiota bacterium]MBT3951776.1 hypothetical protein [Candidatus Neomarinimicrobiota bacterium]MBT4252790.1 hypothetical protein [Candidatus Neomarinimicrobiota bacterium]
MKKLLPFIFILVLTPLVSLAQFNISGELTPGSMLRISDGSLIDLPFRLGNISLDYAYGDFEFKSSFSLETRWKNPEISEDMFQLREAYMVWYPNFGEVKLGKMIHAWGAADGNNPTDNLSPYDFYYMFLSGTDRKLGTLSASSLVYVGSFQLQLVVLPDFVENRIPYDEPDFPIQIELPPGAVVTDPENAVEWGGKIQYAMGLGDISISLFDGYDHMQSPAGIQLALDPSTMFPTIIPQLTYRKTRMYGIDGVVFPGNWTVRGELGYFQTKTPELDLDASLLVTDASYIQSVLQVEYSFSNGLQLMGQYIGTDYGEISNEIKPDIVLATLPDEIQHGLFQQMNSMDFQAGMGTPFAMIAERVFIASSMFETLDNNLELRAMLMVNLDETGYMTNIGASYALIEGFSLDATLAYFIGGDEAENSFKKLEDFSNLNLGLSYSF